MRVWITRANPGANATAARLVALGHETLTAPLLEVRAVPATPDLTGIGALAFTSANGVQAFAALTDERTLPVFVVGAATAQAARHAGFARVESAEGDVEDLALLIDAGRRGFSGAILAPGAVELAGDLVGALAAGGLRAQALPVYETVDLGPAPEVRAALEASPPALDAVLVHSARAAQGLAKILADKPGTACLFAFCLSKAVAAPLSSLNFRLLRCAQFPNEAALLKLLAD